MRIQGNAVKAILIALTVALIPASAVSAQKITPGTACKVFNQKITYLNKTYTCIKSGKKFVWNKGVAVVKPTPVASATPTPTETPTSVPSPSPNPTQTVIPTNLTAGSLCNPSTHPNIKVSAGTLYCVRQGDGTMRFIEVKDQAPLINNPNSLEKMSACQPPDLRNGIPDGNFRWAITYPATPVTLTNKGSLKMSIVPIDFPDVAATTSASNLYGEDIQRIVDWFSDFSNGKLIVKIETKDKWYRALKSSDYYDVGEGTNFNKEGKSTNQLIQEFIDLSNSDFNFSDSDAILFVYPEKTPSIRNSFAENLPIVINGKSKTLFEMSLASANRLYGPAWIWTVHEMLHQMGIAMHFPVNPPNWGIEWGGFTKTPVLQPWNQGILDWLNPDQYYCVDKSKLTKTNLTLLPLENPGAGLHSAFIRISNSEVLMVVSNRKGPWSIDLPESYYGVMVAVIDTTKQTSYIGEHSGEDKQDGVLFQKSGVYLQPENPWPKNRIWTRTETGDWGSLLYLGDSVTYKGVKVKLVSSNNFDTVEISAP